MKYLIGNWKANKTIQEARSWIAAVKKESSKANKNLKTVLCPSFIHLALFKRELPQMTLGCQDLSSYPDGAYTGQVSARMISGLVKYAILGHSERRRYFQETETQIMQKVTEALDNGITPIIAVDADNWRRQIHALEKGMIQKSILMYEPPEAISRQIGSIGRGKPAPLAEVKEMVAKIKKATKIPTVIYGGSIKSHNLATFLEEPLINGVLPGSASLNAEEWIRMVKIANQIAEAAS